MPNRALALCVSCMVDSGAFHMTVCYSRLLYIFTCMRKGGRRGEGGRGEREGREGGERGRGGKGEGRRGGRGEGEEGEGRRGEGKRGKEGRGGGGGGEGRGREGTPPLFSLYEISAVKEVISDPNQCAYCVPQCL